MELLALNIDEVGKNIKQALPLLKELGINQIELRLIEEKNIAHFTSTEIAALHQEVSTAGLEVCTLASPLFKWYRQKPNKERVYDSFNFPSYLTDDEKKKVIKRVIDHARQLACSKIRIFSNLNNGKADYENFLKDPLLPFAQDYAAKKEVLLLVENEPVCQLFSVKDLHRFILDQQQAHLWLDIANFYYINDFPSKEDILDFLPYTHHLHLKDFIWKEGKIHHVPLGEGIVPWKDLLPLIFEHQKGGCSYSIETHVTNHKIEACRKSARFFRQSITTKSELL